MTGSQKRPCFFIAGKRRSLKSPERASALLAVFSTVDCYAFLSHLFSSFLRMRIVMIMLAFLLALLQYRLWVGEGSIAQLMAVKEQVALQKLENQRLAERNRLLAVDVVALQTGLEAVEEYARTELGMIRHDEEFFLMAD